MREGLVGHPPDTAWLCSEHAPVGRALAPLVDIELALSQMRAADRAAPQDPEPASRESEQRPGMEIGAWTRVLRRAIPDLAVEAGCVSIEVEESDGQETYYQMDGSPPEVSPFTWTQQWCASDAGATVCLYTETAYWNTQEVARVEAVMMVTPHADEALRCVVAALSPVGSTRIGPEHVRVVEGRPSPMLEALLEEHGLTPAPTGDQPSERPGPAG